MLIPPDGRFTTHNSHRGPDKRMAASGGSAACWRSVRIQGRQPLGQFDWGQHQAEAAPPRPRRSSASMRTLASSEKPPP
jgi:hypothetical protein